MTPKELAGALRRQLNPRRARWQKPAAVVRALGLRRGQVVAEIGSGPGYFTPRLARAVGPSGHVYAVDPEAACSTCCAGAWDGYACATSRRC